MKFALACVAALAAAAFAQTPQTPDPNIHYHTGPDSLVEGGVPEGEVRGPFTLPIEAYPGTQYLLGLRPGAIRRLRSRQPDDLQRWAGLYAGGRRPAGANLMDNLI